MARPCSVCTHKSRNAIDKGLVAGEPFRALERQFGVSRDALRRHKMDHIPATVAKAQEAVEVIRGDVLLAHLEALRQDAQALQKKAETGKAFSAAIAAIREQTRLLELGAKLQGELKEGNTVNVLVMPEWLALRGRILEALEPFPEARLALVRELEHAGG